MKLCECGCGCGKEVKNRFINGHSTKGKYWKMSITGRKRVSESKKGEKNPNWKDTGHYVYCHEEARKLFGKPCCESCSISLEEYCLRNHRKKQFEMHCVSKDYKILEQWNWRCLCYSCHRRDYHNGNA